MRFQSMGLHVYVSGMLDYAQVIAGGYKLRCSCKKVKSMVEGVKKLFAHNSEIKSIPIEGEFLGISEDSFWVTDWSLVKRVLVERVRELSVAHCGVLVV